MIQSSTNPEPRRPLTLSPRWTRPGMKSPDYTRDGRSSTPSPNNPSLKFNPAPVLRAPLHSRTRRPRNARFVDVFTERSVAFVAVINDQIETSPPAGGHSDFGKWNRRLNPVAVRRAARHHAGLPRRYFDR